MLLRNSMDSLEAITGTTLYHQQAYWQLEVTSMDGYFFAMVKKIYSKSTRFHEVLTIVYNYHDQGGAGTRPGPDSTRLQLQICPFRRLTYSTEVTMHPHQKCAFSAIISTNLRSSTLLFLVAMPLMMPKARSSDVKLPPYFQHNHRLCDSDALLYFSIQKVCKRQSYQG